MFSCCSNKKILTSVIEPTSHTKNKKVEIKQSQILKTSPNPLLEESIPK